MTPLTPIVPEEREAIEWVRERIIDLFVDQRFARSQRHLAFEYPDLCAETKEREAVYLTDEFLTPYMLWRHRSWVDLLAQIAYDRELAAINDWLSDTPSDEEDDDDQ